MKLPSDLQMHATRFQLKMHLGDGYRLIRLGNGEYGLYLHGFFNEFGTPLALRGQYGAIEQFLYMWKEGKL